ncbi:MAG: hypothetical protein ABII00_15815 [Elusimicrobiota bacterium]
MEAVQGNLQSKRASAEADAVMAVAVVAAVSGGRLQKRALEYLRMLAFLNATHAGIGNVDDYIGSMLETVTREGQDHILERSAIALSLPMRERAYAWAAEIASTYGKGHSEGHAFLERLRERLGIDKGLAGKIDKVAEIRNRPISS